MTYHEIIEELKLLANEENVKFKEKKFGIVSNNALGIYHKDLKALAKQIKKNDELAIQLFESNIYEARILCSMIYNPNNLTEELMEKWIRTFENWEICDSFCMALFAKSSCASFMAVKLSDGKGEFEKRAAFSIMAALCMSDKYAENAVFEEFLDIIKRESTDDRQYVKKAVNWALRNIGKRNKDLKESAIICANEILKLKNKTADWIANDAIKELRKENVRCSDYPRHIYRV